MSERTTIRRYVLWVVLLVAVSLAGCAGRNSAQQTAGEEKSPEGEIVAQATPENDAHNTLSPYYATVGGGSHNTATAAHATVSGGAFNTASVEYAVVSGGSHNTADATRATIGGGYGNSASHIDATVAGGGGNSASGRHATVSGGSQNTAAGVDAGVGGGSYNIASGNRATVGGGARNVATGFDTTISGGAGNTAAANSATVGGGLGNDATDIYATVGGGYGNTASGSFSVVAGGAGNIAAGDYSFASGHLASVDPAHAGAFVYADSNELPFYSATPDEFAVRATGGVRLVTAIGGDGAPLAGAELPSGSGSWSSLSDAAVKTNVAAVDGFQILALLAGLPIETWNYSSQDPGIRHIGPTAQDFNAAFGVGEDEQHISVVDADGVALAAIQALYQLVQEQGAQITTLEGRVAALEARLAALEEADN
jgi:hypothetical protein